MAVVSAERLREAAEAMVSQHGPDHPRSEMWVAMADLLAVIAVEFEYDDHSEAWEPYEQALAVAAAYLGAAP